MPKNLHRTRQLILDQLEARIVFDAAQQAAPEPESTDAGSDSGSMAEQSQVVETAEAEDVRRELVLVDAAVEDIETLLDQLETRVSDTSHLEIVLLDPNRNGVEQITEILDGYSDLSAIHVLSHGDDGAIRLGDEWLTNDSLGGYAGEIARWGDSLTTDADLLIYGCDVAGSADGIQLVEALQTLTGADVAASTDDTGHADLGGDWDLEYHAGEIESQIVVSEQAQEDWRHVLAVGASVSFGSAGQDVFLGDNFSFTIDFENTGAPGETGYAPFIDLYFPTAGPDGLAGMITEDSLDDMLDGLSFGSADGYVKKVHVLTFGDDDGETQYDGGGTAISGTGTFGTLDHPVAASDTDTPTQVVGNTGDTLVVVELNFGSFVPTQPGGEITVSGSLSGLADLGAGLSVRARGGFRFGETEFDDPNTDPTIFSQNEDDARNWTQSHTITPKLLDLTASNSGPGEAVTGPNYVHTYRTTIQLAPGQTLSDMELTVDLPNDVVFDDFRVTGATFSGDNAASLSTTAPANGAQLQLTGGTNSASTVVVEVDYWVPEFDADGTRVIPTSGEDDLAASRTTFDSNLTATWTPDDTRDEATPGNVVAGLSTPFERDEKAINVQRDVSNVAGGEPTPGAVLRNAITFQLSDYFTYGDLIFQDVLSDGHLFLLSVETATEGDGSNNDVQHLRGTNLVDYTLSFGGETTGTLSKTATAGDVQTALEGLTSIGAGNVQVTGSNTNGDPLRVEFVGDLANADQNELTIRSTETLYAPTFSVSDRDGTRSNTDLGWRYSTDADNGETFVIDETFVSRLDDVGEDGSTADGTDGQTRITIDLSQAMRDAVGGELASTTLVDGGAGNERQQIDGTDGVRFGLTFGGETTNVLSASATAADVQAALEGLSTVGAGNVSVSGDGTAGNEFVVEFQGTLANTDVAELTVENPAGILTGGQTQPGDTAGSPASAATGTIVFYTVVQEEFADTFASGDRSVDQGDRLTGSTTISGTTRDNDDFFAYENPSSPHTETDGGADSITIAQGELSTAIFSINGDTSASSPYEISVGDEVTYQIRYTLPSSDFEDLVLSDFLPQPIFDVLDPDGDGSPESWSFASNVGSNGNVPASGEVWLGPGDTFFTSRPGESDYFSTSDITVDGDLNALQFTFGDYDDPTSTASAIELLLTVTVTDEPFANGLSLTNIAQSQEASTNGTASSDNQIQNVIIQTPELHITKGVVAVTGPNGLVVDVADQEVVADERHLISGTASGDFRLTIGGETTALIDQNATASEVRTALGALSNIGDVSNVLVSGGPADGTPYEVTFVGTLAGTPVGTFTSDDVGHTATRVQQAGANAFGGVIWNAPSSGTPFSGTISSNAIAEIPVDGNVANIDADDVVRVAILVENQGDAPNGAFDVTLLDEIPDGYSLVGGSVAVVDGTGAALTFTGDLFSGGLVIDDPGATEGSIGANDNLSGGNIAVVYYDLVANADVRPLVGVEPSAEVTNYAAREGGQNYTESDLVNTSNLEDDALIGTRGLGLSKERTATGELQGATPADDDFATIGETVEYTVTIEVPEGESVDVVLTDVLDRGLAVVQVDSITASSGLSTSEGTFNDVLAAATISNVGSGTVNQGRELSLDFGTVTNANTDDNVVETITVKYTAIVLNATSVESGDALGSASTLDYGNGTHTFELTADAEDVTVVEPSVSVAATADKTSVAGSELVTYTITVTASDETSHGVELDAIIPDGLTYETGTLRKVSGPDPDVGTLQVVTGSDVRVEAEWTTLDADDVVVLEFQATVDTDAVVEADLDVESEVTWSSLPGDQTSAQSTHNSWSAERTGDDADLDTSDANDAGEAGANDYASQSTATVTVASPTIVQSVVSTSIDQTVDGGPNTNSEAVVGEIVRFRTVVTLPDGASPGSTISVLLSNGLAYHGNTVVTGVDVDTNLAGGFARITAPSNTSGTGASGSPQTLTFTLGDLTDPVDDVDGTITLEFDAVVLNDDVNDRNDTRTSTGSFDWTGRVNDISDSSDAITVIEPRVQSGQSIFVNGSTNGGNATGDGGDDFEIQYWIRNYDDANRSDAYDLTFSDTLPNEFGGTLAFNRFELRDESNNVIESIDPRSETASNAVLAEIVAAFEISGQTVRTKAGSTFDLPYGYRVYFDVEGTLDGSELSPGEEITNDGLVTTFTSLDDEAADGDDTQERDGSQSPSHNDYRHTGASRTVRVPHESLEISLFDTGETESAGSEVAVGEEVTYAIRVTLPEGTTTGLRLDTLLPDGLDYLSVALETDAADSNGLLTEDFGGTVSIAGTTTAAATGGETVSVTFNDITTTDEDAADEADDNSFLLLVTARVANDANADRGDVLTAAGSYDMDGFRIHAESTGFTSTRLDDDASATEVREVLEEFLADAYPALTINNNELNVTKNPEAGVQYRIEFRNEVADTNIADLTVDMPGWEFVVVQQGGGGNNEIVEIRNDGAETLHGINAGGVAPSVTVIEPTLSVTQASSITLGDAGDAITYTYDIDHTGSSNHDAFELVFEDVIPDEVDLSSATVVVERGPNAGSLSTLTSGVDYVLDITSQTVTINGFDLAETDQVRIRVTGTLDTAETNPGETFTNDAASVTWTSLNDGNESGDASVERDGEGSVDDYVAQSGTTAVVIPAGVFDKTAYTTDRSETTGSTVTTGETVTFALRVNLTEGTTPNLQVRERIPDGYRLVGHSLVTTTAGDSQGILLADFNGSAPTYTVSNIDDAGQPFAAGDNALFSFDPITVNGDNNSFNNEFLLLIEAVVVETTDEASLVNNADFDVDPAAMDGFEATPDETHTLAVPDLDITAALSVDGDGDAGDAATFTLTLDNSGSGDAYDVVVEHDLSGLPLENILADTIPAGWTFSVSSGVVTISSNAGTKVDESGNANDSVTFTFTADLTTATEAGETLSTAATIEEFSSLSGETAAESGEFTGSDTSNTVTHTIDSPSFVKTLTGTSVTQAGGANGAFEAVIGERLHYSIVLTVPEGTTSDVSISDLIDDHIIFDATSVVATPATGVSYASFTPSFDGTTDTATFAFGDVTNSNTDNGSNNTITITFDAIVANVADNQSAETRGATQASLDYTVSGSAATTQTSTSGSATIIEPTLTVTHSNDYDASKDANDTVTYTIVITNPGTGEADAFDVSFFDDVPEELDVTSVSALHSSAGNISANFEVFDPAGADNTEAVRTTSSGAFDLAVGESVTIQIAGTLRVSELNPNETVVNSATAQWSSIDGTDSNERDGSDGSAGLNNYIASESTSFDTPPIAVSKDLVTTSRQSDGETVADPKVTIGELVTYRIRITVPEGTTDGVVFVDNLDAGLALVAGSVVVTPDGVTRDDGVAGTDGFTEAEIVSTAGTGATGDAQTITFDLDTLINAANDADAEVLEIVYQARVLDIAANVDGVSLGDGYSFTYAGGGAATTGSTPDVDVVEPALNIVQTMTVNGTLYDDPATLPVADAGDAVSYTFTIGHTAASTADAFDIAFTDVLPDEFTIGSVSADHSDTTTYGSGANNLGAAAPGSGQTVSLTGWDLAEGETITVTVSGTLNTATTNAATTFANNAAITWTTLDDGANDGDTAADVGERTTYSDTSDTEAIATATPTFAKHLSETGINSAANDNTEATIGEWVEYTLTVTLPEGVTNDVVLTDLIEPGLSYVDGSATLLTDANVTASLATDTSTPGELVFTLGDVVNDNATNGTAETVRVRYRVTVDNSAANNAGVGPLGDTTASLDYTDGSAAQTTQTDSADGITVVESRLTIAQTVNVNGTNYDNPATAPIADAGDSVAYTYTVAHSGSTADAYDLVLSNTLPDAFDAASASVVVQVGSTILTEGVHYEVDVTGQNFTLTGVAGDGFDLANGQTLTVTVASTLATATTDAGSVLSNQASVVWSSLDDNANDGRTDDTGERTSGGGIDDYAATSDTESIQIAGISVTKTLSDTGIDSVSNSDSEATIGEWVEYTLQLTLPEGVTNDVVLTDLIEDGLAYVDGSLGVSGTNITPEHTVVTDNDSNIVVDLGDVTNANTDGTGGVLTLTYRTLVENVAGNQGETDTTANLGDTQVSVAWTDGTTAQTAVNDMSTGVDIVEATLEVAQQLTLNGVANPGGSLTGDAGDAIQQRYTITHAAASTADAYDLVFEHLISSAIDFEAGDVTVAGGRGTASVSLTAVGDDTRLTITGLDFVVGDSPIVVTIDGALDQSAEQSETYANDNASVTWTSLDAGNATDGLTAADAGERDSSGGVNDSVATANATPFTIASLGTQLVRVSDSEVAIGETVTFAVLVTPPEGTASDLAVRLDLPDGLVFGNATVETSAAGSNGLLANDFDGVTPTLASTTGGGADGGDVTFVFDPIVTTGEDHVTEGADNSFLLYVTAVVENDADTNRGDVLATTAVFDTDGEVDTDATAVPESVSSPPSVTIVEPALSLNQVVTLNGDTHPGGSPVGNAGDSITYTYTIDHTATSDADAFDITFTDTLPDEIDLTSAVIRVDGAVVTPTISGQTVTVSGLDLAEADDAVITIEAVLSATEVTIDETVTNDPATITWTSLNDDVASGGSSLERDGAGTFNDHAAASNTTTFVTDDAIDVSHSLFATSADSTNGSDVAVGETVTFAVTVTLPEGSASGFILRENLPDGLTFVSAAIETDSANAGGLLADDFAGTIPSPAVTNGGGGGDDVILSFGNIVVDGDNDVDTNSFVVLITARVTNDADVDRADVLTASANYDIDGELTTDQRNATDSVSAAPTVTVVEPTLTVSQTLTLNGETSPGVTPTGDAGDEVVFTYAIDHATGSDADAFDLTLTDTLPEEFDLDGSTIVVRRDGAVLSEGTDYTVSKVGDTLTVTGLDSALGDGLVVEVTGTLETALTDAGETIVNDAGSLTWTSLDGAEAGERDGSETPAFNDYSAVTGTTTMAIDGISVTKTLSDTGLTSGTNDDTQVVIGEWVEYTIELTLPEGVTNDVVLTDLIEDGLAYVPGSLSVSGSGITPEHTIVTDNDSNIVIDLGDVTNANTDGTGGVLTLTYRTLVENVAGNQGESDTVANLGDTHVSVAWTDGSTAQTAVTDTSTGVDVIEPVLSITQTVALNGVTNPGGTPVGDAGDAIVYTYAVDHTAASTADANDLTLTQSLAPEVTFDAGDIVVERDGVVLTAGVDYQVSVSGQDFTITEVDLRLGRDLNVRVNGTLSDALTNPNETIASTNASLTWSSLDGTFSRERTGDDGIGGALNDYAAETGVTAVTIGGASFDKSLFETSFDATTGSDVAIGEQVTYAIRVTLPEGTTDALVINEALPDGLRFVSADVLTDAANSKGLLTSDYAGLFDATPFTSTTPGASGDDVTFTFNPVTTTGDNDGSSNSFLLLVTAEVVNEAGNERGIDLAATTTSDVDGELAIDNEFDGPITVTVVEPTLTVSQTRTLNGGTSPGVTPTGDAGDEVVFTYAIDHASGSDADAFDLTLTDTLPEEFDLAASTIVVRRDGAVLSEGADYTVSKAGDTLTVTGLDSAVGDGLVVEVTGTLKTALTDAGETIVNDPASLTWTSLDGADTGERDGSETPAFNDYSAVTGTTTMAIDGISVTKTLSDTGLTSGTNDDTQVVIGEWVEYTVELTLPEGVTNDVVLTDLIEDGLAYVDGSLSVSGTGITTERTVATDNDSNIVVDLGDVTNANVDGSNGVLTLTYRAVVENVAANQGETDTTANLGDTQVSVAWTDGSTAQTAVTDTSTGVDIVEPELEIEQTWSDDTPHLGDTVTITLDITHAAGSTSDAYDIRIIDAIPETLTLTVASLNVDGAVVTRNDTTSDSLDLQLEAIAPGGTVQITFDAVVTSDPSDFGQMIDLSPSMAWESLPGVDIGQRTGVGGLNDYVANDADTATIVGADLAIDVTDDRTTAVAGDEYAYTITVDNVKGTDDATGAQVVDTLDLSTLEFVGTDRPTEVSFDPTTGRIAWNVDTLSVGATETLSVTVRVRDDIAAGIETIPNTSVVSHDDIDPTSVDNTDTDSTNVLNTPDMVLTISDQDVTASTGDPLTYELTYRNDGTQDATGVVATVTLPIGTSYTPSLNTSNWQTTDGVTFTLSLGDVAVDETADIEFVVTVDETHPAGRHGLSLQAAIADDATNGADPTPADNADIEATPLDAAPDLIVSTASDVSVIRPDEVVTFTLSFENAGDQGATGVVLSETVPAGTVFDAASSTPGWSTTDGVIYTFDVGDLEAGETDSLEFAVRVTDPVDAARELIVNHVAVNDDSGNGDDRNPADNADDQNVQLEARPDLFVTKSDGDVTAETGGSIVYTIEYGNNGNQHATGVVLTETLPPHVVFDPTRSSTGWATVDGETYTLAIGDVDVHHVGTVTFAVTVADTLPANVDSLASPSQLEDDGRGGADEDWFDNEASVTTTIVAEPDYAVHVSGPDDVSPGDAARFDVTVNNTGDQEGTGIVITHTFDPDVLKNVTASHGGVVDITAGTITWTIASLPSGGEQRLSIEADVESVVGDDKEGLPQTTSVTDDGSNGVDPTPGNNTFAAVTPIVAAADYRVEVVTPDDVAAGELFSLTFEVFNDGNQDGDDVRLTTTIPLDGVEGLRATGPDGVTIELNADGTLSAVIDELSGGGQSVVIELAGRVKDALPAGIEEVSAQVVVTDASSSDPDAESDTVSANYDFNLVGSPEYEVTITSEPEIAMPGEPIQYAVSIRNNGDQNGTGVEIRNIFPPEILLDAVASDGGIVDRETGTVVWNMGDLAVGESMVCTVDAMVAPRVELGTVAFTHFTSIRDDGASGADPIAANNVDHETDLLPLFASFSFDSLRNEGVPGVLEPSGNLNRNGSDDIAARLSDPANRDGVINYYGGSIFRDQPPFRIRVQPLPLHPIYSGQAQPGTTIHAKIYDNDGNVVGEQTVVTDAGGNWMMSMPGTTIHEQPHRLEVTQTAAGYASADDSGFNFRRFFQSAIHSSIFFAEEYGVNKVLREGAYATVRGMHEAAENPLGFKLAGYTQLIAASSTNGES